VACINETMDEEYKKELDLTEEKINRILNINEWSGAYEIVVRCFFELNAYLFSFN
jgi:hypothetical protein